MNFDRRFFVIILGAILFVNATVLPITTFAQIDPSRPPITVQWKLADYPEGTYTSPDDGTNILIFGVVNAGYETTFEVNEWPEFPVTIRITSPAGDIVYVNQLTPTCTSDQCYFETLFTVGGDKFEHTGQYRIHAQFKEQGVQDDFPYIKSPTSNELSELRDDFISEPNAQVLSLQVENKELRQQISSLQSQVIQLEKQVDDLNAIIQEQIKVIIQWIKTR